MGKLNQAKQNLSQALTELETTILDKINQAKTLAVANSGLDKNNQELVNNFHNEINSLQKSLAELGTENEQLRNFKNLANEVVGQVKIDLSQIRKIVNKK
ncbi:MAG: hypothetical protein V4612_02925 [Pseudomonadota bacterium]